jgi:hypothetical protein
MQKQPTALLRWFVADLEFTVISNNCWGAHIYDALGICSPKASGGPLYKLGKSTGTKSNNEIDLPKQAFAVLPISMFSTV